MYWLWLLWQASRYFLTLNKIKEIQTSNCLTVLDEDKWNVNGKQTFIYIQQHLSRLLESKLHICHIHQVWCHLSCELGNRSHTRRGIRSHLLQSVSLTRTRQPSDCCELKRLNEWLDRAFTGTRYTLKVLFDQLKTEPQNDSNQTIKKKNLIAPVNDWNPDKTGEKWVSGVKQRTYEKDL